MNNSDLIGQIATTPEQYEQAKINEYHNSLRESGLWLIAEATRKVERDIENHVRLIQKGGAIRRAAAQEWLAYILKVWETEISVASRMILAARGEGDG